jgi:hypothetical protein
MVVPEVVTDETKVVTNEGAVTTDGVKVVTNEPEVVTDGVKVTTGSLFLPPNGAILLKNGKNGQRFRLFS